MQYSSLLTTLFWVNKSRTKDNSARLYLRITLDQKRANISLKQEVNLELWDNKRKQMKGRSQHAQTINSYIDHVKGEILSIYQDLKSEDKTITPQRIKINFLGKDQNKHSLSSLFDYFNEKMSRKLAKKTKGHYRTSQKYILNYILSEYKFQDIYLKDLDYPFLIGFEHFLRCYNPRHYQSSLANNAVMKHIQRLRRMIRLAYEMEWLDRDPFIKFKPKLEKRQRDFLTALELKRIEYLNIKITRLGVVRDLFVFSCYTGVSYADVNSLSEENRFIGINGKDWLRGKRNKNGNPYEIPLLPKALEILDKYENDPRTEITQKLLPTISNQKLNAYLKEIQDLAEIKKNLTFHMSRHTFATTVTLSNGVPIETVSKMLGHTKLATTQIYAKVIEEKVSHDMDALHKMLQNQNRTKNYDQIRLKKV
ncbi:site-specific integrase [Flavimarina sp. Hel_I_48]|uniref:site-specific integrase n=1 Tax=Flavimarina sp. Hel_I_48 TaxID=1392488 RepID=UPI00056D064B|nr:site-specific integrase [Flavimarina sp. Hel_I_48]